MNKIVLSAVGLTLAGMSTLGLAAPTQMSMAELDQVTAGHTCGCPGNGGGGSLLNVAIVDIVDSNAAAAAASNISGLSLLSLQSATAGNIQSNYSRNVVNQR